MWRGRQGLGAAPRRPEMDGSCRNGCACRADPSMVVGSGVAMSDYMTLLGAEEVRSAGHTMTRAAETMSVSVLIDEKG